MDANKGLISAIPSRLRRERNLPGYNTYAGQMLRLHC